VFGWVELGVGGAALGVFCFGCRLVSSGSVLFVCVFINWQGSPVDVTLLL